MNKSIGVPPASLPVRGAGPAGAGVKLVVPPGYGKGVLLCVAATILLGIMFPVMTDALVHIDPCKTCSYTGLSFGPAGQLAYVARDRQAFSKVRAVRSSASAVRPKRKRK